MCRRPSGPDAKTQLSRKFFFGASRMVQECLVFRFTTGSGGARTERDATHMERHASTTCQHQHRCRQRFTDRRSTTTRDPANDHRSAAFRPSQCRRLDLPFDVCRICLPVDCGEGAAKVLTNRDGIRPQRQVCGRRDSEQEDL